MKEFSEEKMMLIEDGKKYVDGVGGLVTVMLVSPESDYPFTGLENGRTYKADGRYIEDTDMPVSAYALVKLHP